ncbi:MAG: hypothetical protein ABR502_11955 [Chitinophagaceae bacterium]
MPTTKIDEYTVMHSANTFWPRIWLKNGGKAIGQLNFHPNGSALPLDNLNGGHPDIPYYLVS